MDISLVKDLCIMIKMVVVSSKIGKEAKKPNQVTKV